MFPITDIEKKIYMIKMIFGRQVLYLCTCILKCIRVLVQHPFACAGWNQQYWKSVWKLIGIYFPSETHNRKLIWTINTDPSSITITILLYYVRTLYVICCPDDSAKRRLDYSRKKILRRHFITTFYEQACGPLSIFNI